MTDSLSDIEKLRKAFSEVTSAFGSLDNILEAFGLKDLPPTHQYGIMFGFMVYILTIAAVLCLLSFGGTFKRLVEQSEPDGKPAVLSATDARSQRSLLLETLLESRERMLRKYPETSKTEKVTALTEMLLNEKPQQVGGKKHISGSMQAKYEESYVAAYRRCQDRPGGTLSTLLCMFVFTMVSGQLLTEILHKNRFHLIWEARGKVRGLCSWFRWLWTTR